MNLTRRVGGDRVVGPFISSVCWLVRVTSLLLLISGLACNASAAENSKSDKTLTIDKLNQLLATTGADGNTEGQIPSIQDQLSNKIRECLIVPPYKRLVADVTIKLTQLQQAGAYTAELENYDEHSEAHQSLYRAIAKCNPFMLNGDGLTENVRLHFDIGVIGTSYAPSKDAMSGVWSASGGCSEQDNYEYRMGDFSLYFPYDRRIPHLIEYKPVGSVGVYTFEVMKTGVSYYTVSVLTQTSENNVIAYTLSKDQNRSKEIFKEPDQRSKLLSDLSQKNVFDEFELTLRKASDGVTVENLQKCPTLPAATLALQADGIAALKTISSLREQCRNPIACGSAMFASMDVSADDRLSVAEITRYLRMIAYLGVTSANADAPMSVSNAHVLTAIAGVNLIGPAIVKQMVAAYDYDGDGFLSMSELAKDREELLGSVLQLPIIDDERWLGTLRGMIHAGSLYFERLISKW